MERSPATETDVAREILQRELGSREAVDEVIAAIERCFEQFSLLFLDLIGKAGLEALLGRAVHLTRAEVGWLQATVTEDAGVELHGLADGVQREGTAQVIAGMTALLSSLISLLYKFIGRDLTLRLLRRAWADASGISDSSTKEGDR